MTHVTSVQNLQTDRYRTVGQFPGYPMRRFVFSASLPNAVPIGVDSGLPFVAAGFWIGSPAEIEFNWFGSGHGVCFDSRSADL